MNRPAAVFAAGPEARAPNAGDFIALLEAFRATGGTAPGEIVGGLLAEHGRGDVPGLARLVDGGRVCGFRWRGGLWIPMFQFDTRDLSLRPGAQRVRAGLPPEWSGWAQASWFAAANPRLAGWRPADALEVDVEAVVRAARSLATAHAPRTLRAGLRPSARRPCAVAAHV